MSSDTSGARARGRGRGRGRGGYRGGAGRGGYHTPVRGYRGGRGRGSGAGYQRPQRSWLDGLANEPLEVFNKPTEEIGDQDIRVTDVVAIGSYNWVENDQVPTIIVPGKLWSNM